MAVILSIEHSSHSYLLFNYKVKCGFVSNIHVSKISFSNYELLNCNYLESLIKILT